jgi:hypothetical protein
LILRISCVREQLYEAVQAVALLVITVKTTNKPAIVIVSIQCSGVIAGRARLQSQHTTVLLTSCLSQANIHARGPRTARQTACRMSPPNARQAANAPRNGNSTALACRTDFQGAKLPRRTTSFWTSGCFCGYHICVAGQDTDGVWWSTDLVSGYKRGPGYRKTLLARSTSCPRAQNVEVEHRAGANGPICNTSHTPPHTHTCLMPERCAGELLQNPPVQRPTSKLARGAAS